MLDLPVWFEVGSYAALVLVLGFDLFFAFARPRIPSSRESVLWISFYLALALVFAVLLLSFSGTSAASQFVAGWLTEYSLSVDNLFVFLLIMTRFRVPKPEQQKLLMVGIILALILRGIFILIGAALIARWSWVFYFFAAFLIYTAIQQLRPGVHPGGKGDSRLLGWLKHRVSLSDNFSGAKLRVTVAGRKVFTPVLLVLVALGTTDLVFALDSIPAIFGITQSPFIVFMANIFALMGLRQLYFLLGTLVDKLEYLSYGIAFILFFIGVKIALQALHNNDLPFFGNSEPLNWVPEISTGVSLVIILVSITVAVLASLARIWRQSQSSRIDS